MAFKVIITLIISLVCQIALAKELIVISDLDETIRIANIEKKAKAAGKLLLGVKPYEGLRAIYNEIKLKNPDAKFYYLSNSYPFLYNGQKWTKKNGFPIGTVFQRSLKDKSATFKPRKLREIYQQYPAASYLMFGDNVESDPKFYREFLAETKITDVKVFIRDAMLIFTQEPNMTYFQTEAQITDDLNMSHSTTVLVKNLPFNKLVPKFLLKNLKQRLIKSCRNAFAHCEELAEERILEVIDQISSPSTKVAER